MHGLSAVLSALHLLALAVGLPAIVLRAKALQGPLDAAGLRRVLHADLAWGVAAALWITTGPGRAFGPFEKGSTFYLSSPLFYIKLGLFVLVVLLEIGPMVGLIGWRRALRAGHSPDVARAGVYAQLSWIEAGLVLVIVFVASFMARGFGMEG